jgi:hypothetical protein
VGRRGPIQNEQLVRAGRRDFLVRRRRDRTDGDNARNGGEDYATAHDVAMRAGHRRNERDTQSLALERLHDNLVLSAVGPVRVRAPTR